MGHRTLVASVAMSARQYRLQELSKLSRQLSRLEHFTENNFLISRDAQRTPISQAPFSHEFEQRGGNVRPTGGVRNLNAENIIADDRNTHSSSSSSSSRRLIFPLAWLYSLHRADSRSKGWLFPLQGCSPFDDPPQDYTCRNDTAAVHVARALFLFTAPVILLSVIFPP